MCSRARGASPCRSIVGWSRTCKRSSFAAQNYVRRQHPKGSTRPWRTAMPLYRRVKPNMQLLEFRCNEFVEEFMYGNLRKQPLVKHWEGDTMTIDITRKVPPGDLFYQ